MNDLINTPISDFVIENPLAARVFEKHGIDFCCKGRKELSKACEEKDIDPKVIIEELGNITERTSENSIDANEMSPDQLIDHIIDHHHKYVLETLPQIQELMEKVTKIHKNDHPELPEMKQLFEEGAKNLISHMKKEELILFPYIKKLVKSKLDGTNPGVPPFGSIENPIRMMEQEHQIEGGRFEKIRELSGNFEIPDDACLTYMAVYSMLKEFESDLHLHIHLENNILFPKAIKLEKELIDKYKHLTSI